MNIAWRAHAVLVDPAAAWRHIDEEAGDPVYLLTQYVAPLALIPVISGLVGTCVIGVITPGGSVLRMPIGDALLAAAFGYVAEFAAVLLVGFLINALAPHFGGRRDFTKAFKLAVYSFTPVWFCGVFLLMPGLRFLELGGFYGAFLLVKGLPVLMQSPQPKAQPYAAAIVVFAGILTLLVQTAQHALFAPAGM